MKRIYLVIITLVIGLVASGFFCSSISRSGEKGDKFYTHLKNSDYELIINLLDEQALDAHSKEKWLDLLKSRKNYWGNLVSYKNTGFHTETENGITIARLNYTVDNSKGIVYEQLDLIKRGEEFKILAYQYNSDKDKINID